MHFFVFPVVLSSLAIITNAHSWVERLMVIDNSGRLVGNPGYVRGTVSRLSNGFSDTQMQNLLPPSGANRVCQQLSPNDLICRSTQTRGNYSVEFPPLQAKMGDYIALQYQENGHVTLLTNTPQKEDSGLVYIYGTSKPSSIDKLASIHHVWNENGTGGDMRGQLLATWSFDDGRCYQINSGKESLSRQKRFPKIPADPSGADLWCQNDIRLPSNVDGLYTLYWVWDWPSKATTACPNGLQEVYTSCMDININPERRTGSMKVTKTADLNVAGIESQIALASST